MNTPAQFIARWAAASASERANSQLFLAELCDVLGVERPHPHPHQGYSFEFVVPQHHRDGSVTQGRIDLYKRGCFVLESKQFNTKQAEQSELELIAAELGVMHDRPRTGPLRGTERWDDAMFKARGQAERYIRSLPADEPNPPFLIVVDVGDTFEVYADFTQAGKAYLPFPDARSFRIKLADLERDDVRERLRLIWTNPYALDPSRKSAEVTREIAGHLAELAKSLEAQGHKPHIVAEFLSRCLFCMFAEDVGLLPQRAFTEFLMSLPGDGSGFEDVLRQLFREMNTGTGKGISVVLRHKLLHFNGGLFSDDTVLPVNGMQLGLLRAASKLDWKSVEPAIFGTLLERALNPHERHKLGAHYTPRAYVERLVLPTVVEPIRAEWEAMRGAALVHARADRLKEARQEITNFHHKLCNVKVLDPACGSGNFLYVTLEHLKRLEGEVLDEATKYGENFKLGLEGETVDPHQFLGIEINPRAASITELVLWIGYLQWHFRTHGKRTPPEPILKKFKNIECRDAVLAYDGEPEAARDEQGNIKTVWDRRSFKTDMVTGREVPDETKRVSLLIYKNPRPAEWPEADYVVGNPPFLGKSKLREATGDGYAETLRTAYEGVPDSADFVMYWWHKAANLVRAANIKRFGLITTNAIGHTFNARLVSQHLQHNPGVSIVFAVPDHPWVDTQEGAAVRISMTVGALGPKAGELFKIAKEIPQPDGSSCVELSRTSGTIHSDLTVGADVSQTRPLMANEGLTSMGVMLAGRGFIVSSDEALALGFGKNDCETVIRKLRNGRDLLDEPRNVFAIDFTGLEIESARARYPHLFQVLLTRVKPERHANRDSQFRQRWWLFGRSRPELRLMTTSLRRYIATVETAKHRMFHFLEKEILPEHSLIAWGLDDAFHLGVLSSKVHLTFALATGGTLEDRPRYNKTRCFDPFPFPECSQRQKQSVRSIGEELDAHRRRVQAQQPGLTLTGMYNVLEKLRANQPLTAKEKTIHEQGLVSVLKQLHDDLDAAVFDAYGWPKTLTDAEILERVVALNAERAREEANGLIRWLRPEYQNPSGTMAAPALPLPNGEERPAKPKRAKKAKKAPTIWPEPLAERVKAVAQVVRQAEHALTPDDVAKHFKNAKRAAVAEILETLCVMGQAHRGTKKGTYLP